MSGMPQGMGRGVMTISDEAWEKVTLILESLNNKQEETQ
jgi:hypothetical protein